MNTLHDPGSRHRVVERLTGLSPDSTPRWGKMNVGRMVCHLGDSLRMALGELPTTSKDKKLPKGAPTAPELRSTQPAAFAADVERLRQMIDRFGMTPAATLGPPHPLFGPLSGRDWGVLQYRHVDHQFGV